MAGVVGTTSKSLISGITEKAQKRESSYELSLGHLVYESLSHYFEQHKGSLPPPGLYQRILAEVDRPLFFLTLQAVNGNQKEAARILGINRNTLRKKMIEKIQQKEGVGKLQKLSKKL